MNKRLAVTFIFISVMLDSMGIGLIMPVMPDLIQEVEGQGIGTAAVWGGILSTIFAAMQFIFSKSAWMRISPGTALIGRTFPNK